MTREEQVVFCKKCTNRKLDMQQGMLCSITGEKANFAPTCRDYNLDDTIQERLDDNNHLQREDLMVLVSDKALAGMKAEQNIMLGILTSTGVGLVCAVIWAAITASTGYQIGWMAIAIGAAVGVTMGYSGKGVDQIFGYSGAIIALLSCALGNFLSIIAVIANQEELSYLDVLMQFDYSQTFSLMSLTFSPIDILFYGFAIFEGYKYSFRKLTHKEVSKLN